MTIKDRASPSGPVTGIKPASVSVALASLAANGGAAEAVVGVPGAVVGDVVDVSPQTSALGGRALAATAVRTNGSVNIQYVNQGTVTIAAIASVGYDIYLNRR